jgi:hypothetical protein
MALPPVPTGYDSWNEYIEIQGAIIAAAQGLTFQQGKASVKLLDVALPIRQDLGTPSYRPYNIFTTWDDRQVIPQPNPDPDINVAPGRPWRLASSIVYFLITEDGVPLITEDGNNLTT